MKTLLSVIILCLCLITTVRAGPRSSASYTIVTDTVDSGGLPTPSATYSNGGSAGLVAGLATVGSPAEFNKSGYIGQLYNVTNLAVTATSNPATVDGGANLPLIATQSLDDGSYIDLAPASVAWSVVSGPISSINTAGVAQAGVVSQNTAAIVQGVYGGLSSTLNLTVDVPSADFTSGTQTPIVSDGYTATGSSINLALGYAPTSGTALTVVDNTGSSPIQGTFSNLAQGQTVNLMYGGQSYSFTANYNGGNGGNSLVLTLQSAIPTAPAWAVVVLAILVFIIGGRAVSARKALHAR